MKSQGDVNTPNEDHMTAISSLPAETENPTDAAPNDMSSQESVEVLEISDHESLVVEPTVTWTYERKQRGKVIRRSSSS
jgi:hypothetical protein